MEDLYSISYILYTFSYYYMKRYDLILYYIILKYIYNIIFYYIIS